MGLRWFLGVGAGTMAASLACGGLETEEVEMGDETVLLGRHGEWVTASSSDGQVVLTGGADGRVLAWTLEGPGEVVAEVDGPVMALAGGRDWAVADEMSWRRRSGEAVRTDEPVGALAVGPPGVLVGEGLEQITLFGSEGPVWRGQTYKWAYGASFRPDHDEVVAWTWDSEVRRWTTSTGASLESSVDYPGGPLFAGAWLDADRLALVGPNNQEGFAIVWNVETGETESVAALPVPVTAVAPGAEGQVLLGTTMGQVLAWSPMEAEARLLLEQEPQSGEGIDYPMAAPYIAVPDAAVVGLHHVEGGVMAVFASGVVWRLPEAAPMDAPTVSVAPAPAAVPYGWLDEGMASWARGDMVFRGPESLEDQGADFAWLMMTRDGTLTVKLGLAPGVSDLAKAVADTRGLNDMMGGSSVDEARPDGHIIGRRGSITRYVVRGDALWSCYASSSGAPEGRQDDVLTALVTICDSAEFP